VTALVCWGWKRKKMVSPPVYANDTKLGGCCVIREPLALSYSSLYRKEKKEGGDVRGARALTSLILAVCAVVYTAQHISRARIITKTLRDPSERARARTTPS
jgi:hypothetical protein